MKLLDAIKQKRFKLTDKEKIVLQAIRNQGSFYEESLGGGEFEGQAFFGYGVLESDVGYKFNPAGVVSSLIKKGILEAGDPLGDGSVGYWINYELDFAEDGDTIIFEEAR